MLNNFGIKFKLFQMINNNGLKSLDLFKIKYSKKINSWAFKNLILNSSFKFIKLLFKWYNKLFKMISNKINNHHKQVKQDKVKIRRFRKYNRDLYLTKVYNI